MVATNLFNSITSHILLWLIFNYNLKIYSLLLLKMNKTPTIININNKEYYNTEELSVINKEYFKICGTRIRTIVQWKKIPPENYVFAYIKDNKWILSKQEYPKSKLLLSKEYSNQNILNVIKPITKKIIKTLTNKISTKDVIKPQTANTTNINESPITDNTNEELPPLLTLKDDEKFKDIDGKPLDIEVRGEKQYEKIFFKVRDVMISFEMPSLEKTLTDERKEYYINKHYKYFYSFAKGETVKSLYLTYLGIIRLLFVSRNKNAEVFQSWANKILYIHQMGTIEQKQELGKNLIGVPYQSAKQCINTFPNEISCIYLIILGKVCDVRDSMNIPDNYNDDMIICKYGYSNNFKQRMDGHRQDFKNIKGVNLCLKQLCIIDPLYTTQAEVSVKNYVSRYSFNYKDYKELIIVNNEDLKNIEEKYLSLYYRYSCNNKELNEIINALKTEIKDYETKLIIEKMEKDKLIVQLDYQNKFYEERIKSIEKDKLKDIEIIKKDSEIIKRDYEILKKELYIKELEMQIIKQQKT
jgi:hypothetical protein